MGRMPYETLEEFWYGTIEPTEYNTNACKEYKEVLRLITRNEEKHQARIVTGNSNWNDPGQQNNYSIVKQ